MVPSSAHVIPTVLGTASEVLDVGRTQRLVTAAIWKALVARDAHCLIHAGPWTIKQSGTIGFEFEPPARVRRRILRPPPDG